MKDPKELPSRSNNIRPLHVAEEKLQFSPEAEAAVIGALVNFPERLEFVVDRLRATDFYRDEHRAIYECMVSYLRRHGVAPDFLTLGEMLADQGQPYDLLPEVCGNADHILIKDLRQDIGLVLNKSAQRQVKDTAQRLAQASYDIVDADALRAVAEKLLYELTMAHAPTSDFQPIEDILAACMNDIERASKNRGMLLGVTTGFTDINRVTNGLQKSDLIILGGRPGQGKTSLGMGMGYNAAHAGKVVAVFSLEMGAKQLGMRLLSRDCGIPSNQMGAGWLDDDEMERVVRSQDRLSELPIYIDDTAGSPIASIRSKLTRLKARIHRPIDLVIVDYIGLMDSDEPAAKRENRNQEIDMISRGLKAIAREYDVPVLALAQLSRDLEKRSDKRPQLSDLRDSGGLEQNADIVLFVYRDEMYNPDTQAKGLAEIIIAKHRNGPTGTVTLRFKSELTSFHDEDAYITPGEDTDD